MEWVKEVGVRGANDGGWRGDFPLDHKLPSRVQVDCRRLRLPIHPMFAVRLRIFTDWHRAEGREVEILAPEDLGARQVFRSMDIDPRVGSGSENDAILAVARLKEFQEVENVAEQTREILEYQLPDVSPLGQAAFMAVSELCANAIDHGQNSLGRTQPFGE